MEITKLSTKGQVVIPEQLRQDFEAGTAFVVTRTGKMIILKEVEGLTKKEIKEMKELDKIWNDIDKGKGLTKSKEEFLKEIKIW